ncbi:Glycyl-glycine endopeptidase ALE-1 precursor [Pannonibacter phragmitetus]|uniref:Glycyl-glycine endopeptidase ALE-1 n=1 Tax=Pannonibacter phragmitetus TaxID=121719 RepID=A0A378ZZT5_9HYPH|nr:M23 family metallopeptidase [Pannonibacter phragmitetus]SUB02744.1 Glycyl-glycine endopeptidase ALE-1 precursor [Pannonibacter phragmitetus]
MHLGPFQSHALPAVELGTMPPLVVYDERNALPDRRKVSLRWLTGTVLTGVTSIVLMGGALIAALDGQYRVAAATAHTPNPEVLSTAGASTKGDRVSKAAAQFTSKRVIPLNVVTRSGDQEHIKAKPYTFVNTTLTTRRLTDVEGRIPAFNPLQMFADQKPLDERTVSDAVYSAKSEGEFTLAQSDFPVNSPLIDTALTPSETEVERQVRASAQFLSESGVQIASRTIVDPDRFDFDLARQPDFARLSVRITQENVSFVSKQAGTAPVAGFDERIIPVEQDMAFKDILLDNQASDPEAEAILAAFRFGAGILDVAPGDRLRIALGADPADPTIPRVERVSIYTETQHKATVARSDNGIYVTANEPAGDLLDAFAEADRDTFGSSAGGPSVSLYESVYQTALEQQIPEDLIKELIGAFSYDVDFNGRVQPGDSLEVFYGGGEDENGGDGEILYASLHTGSAERRLYRFRAPDDGSVDYYDEEGRSAKKFLMRKPLSGGTFRSGFGVRQHPIYGFGKMHTGVDWSAPRGTPIMASGNGTIIKAGWESGYGKRVELRHANGYVTTYNHMNDFGPGIKEGGRVTQGQIIGYVGSTGLSTGPHLHYEVLVNNNFVDPMRIRLPRGRVLDGGMLANFEQERTRIDALLERGQKPSRFAAASASETVR